MSKSAVKISLDLLSNPLCEQDQDFLNMVTALDTAMKRMDAFNQEKVPGVGSPPSRGFCLEEHLHGVLNRAQAPRCPRPSEACVLFPVACSPWLPRAHVTHREAMRETQVHSA